MVAEPKDLKHRGKVKNKREFFRLHERLRIGVKAIKRSEEDKLTGETKIEKVGGLGEHYTIDISAGGLQFLSRWHYRANTHVEISLYFRRTDPLFEPITVNARILRVEQIENSQNHKVSVMYVDIDKKTASHLEGYIFTRQREILAEKRAGYL